MAAAGAYRTNEQTLNLLHPALYRFAAASFGQEVWAAARHHKSTPRLYSRFAYPRCTDKS